MNRIPIIEFTYDPATRKFFRYGQERVAAGVDRFVEPVVHDGVTMKASQWLKRYGACVK